MDVQSPVDAGSVIDDLERRFGSPEDNGQACPARARTAELHGVRAAMLEGDRPATERQHAKGKLTVRERITLLLDEGSFHEVEPLRRRCANA
jgi:acetyl-CoA carboxylase carboxyltransferase component